MSYQSALEAAGCEIIDMIHTGCYQGEWYAVVKYEGDIGVVTGSYGSCSVCDSFEAEFDYCDDEKDDYQERLKSFGETYLPPLPVDHEIEQLTKRLEEYNWRDEREALDFLLKVKKEHNL
jgi:hypothetical protein